MFYLDGDNDASQKFIKRRRDIPPVYYSDFSKRFLSWALEETVNGLFESTCFTTEQKSEILLLKKAVGFLEEKMCESAFDEREKRAIQMIVLDDDSDDEVEMEILLPKPIRNIKQEPEADSVGVVHHECNDYVSGHEIPFQLNVNMFIKLLQTKIY